MVTKPWGRRVKWESQAHSRRPEPLAMEMSPTIPAAAAAVACVISCASGEPREMMETPAVVLRNSIRHSAYPGQLRGALWRGRPAADLAWGWAEDGAPPRRGAAS